MGKYAEGTTVDPESSQAEIGKLVRRYGASGFMQGWEGDQAVVGFTSHNRMVRFILTLPSPDDPQFRADGRNHVRTPTQRRAACDAEVRRLWRALALAIKAKFEVVESGIATFEQEFLAHVVLPDGSTVGERVAPELDRAIAAGGAPRTLLALPSGA